MKIRMKTLSAGPAGVRHPGKTYDLAEDQARDLIAGNYATAIAEQSAALLAATTSPAPAPEIQHATAPPPPAQKATAPPAPAALGRRKRA